MPRPRSDATLRRVAERAGVHYATASRALDPTRRDQVRPATRAKVERAAHELNYRPDLLARSLRRGATQTVGLIVADLANPFIAPVIRGITEAIERDGYLPIIAESRDDSRRLGVVIERLLSRRVDGIIVAAAREGDQDAIAAVMDAGVEVVLAARGLEGTAATSVTFDGVRAGELVADHLLRLEHRSFAQLEGPPEILSFGERRRGFFEAVRRAGGELVDQPLVARDPAIEEGRRLMTELLDLPTPPTAIFAHNDLLAVGAIEAIEARGKRCPEDYSVVGHDDSPLIGRISPPLTTVSTPGVDLGRLAARTLVGMLAEPGTQPPSLSLLPTLVVRQSTALRSHEADW